MPFLTAAWRQLVLANYVVDPAVLTPWLPPGLEFDAFEGRHYVSLVGFLFQETCFAGVPAPFHQSFEEVNLRFYVGKTDADGQWRRGVVFIKEIVPKWAVTAIARGVYGEPYATRPMRHRLQVDFYEYAWRDGGRWHRLAARTSGPARPMPDGGGEEFITEHFWGYGTDHSGRTREYRVEHPRWQVYDVESYEVDCDFRLVYGEPFAFLNAARPDSVMVAEGSAVSVFPQRIESIGAGC